MNKIILTFILMLTILKVFSQANMGIHKAKFYCVQTRTTDIRKIYDSLQVPLLIYDNMIYTLSVECIVRDAGGNANNRNAGGSANDRNAGGSANDRNAGGNANDRNAGGNANDRNAGGNANDRNAGGNANDRNAGGNANDRNAGGNANDRNAGGNANDRNAGGNANDRNAGGDFALFSCSNNADGKLNLYFRNIKVAKSVKVYFNHYFFTSKDNFFKSFKL